MRPFFLPSQVWRTRSTRCSASAGFGTADGARPQVREWRSAFSSNRRTGHRRHCGRRRDRRVQVGELGPGAVDPDLAPATDIVRRARGDACGYSSIIRSIRCATGLSSFAVTSQPSRAASSGIAPPPANRSTTFGGYASVGGEHFLSRLADRRLRAAPAAERVEELRQLRRVAVDVLPLAPARHRQRLGPRREGAWPTTGAADAGWPIRPPTFSLCAGPADGTSIGMASSMRRLPVRAGLSTAVTRVPRCWPRGRGTR